MLYLASLDSIDGRLFELRMAPMQARRLRLHRAGPADTAWLARTLSGVSAGLSPQVTVADDGMLVARPSAGAAR